MIQAVKGLTAQIERVARNPVPPLIGDYLKDLKDGAEALRNLAEGRLDGVVKFLRPEIDGAIQDFCRIAGTTEEARLLFGDNGPAACAALLSDPKGALPYLQESLLYEVFGSYLWQFLDAVKRIEGTATDFLGDLVKMKEQIAAAVRREADAALNEVIDTAATAAAEAAVKAMSAYTALDSGAREAIKSAAAGAANWIAAPNLEAQIRNTVDAMLPKPGTNRTVDAVAADIRSVLPNNIAETTKTWRSDLATKIETAVTGKLNNPDLGAAIASIPAAVANVVATELPRATAAVKMIVNDAVPVALNLARGAARAAAVTEADKIIDAVASAPPLSFSNAKRDAFKAAVTARIDQALGTGITAGLGPAPPAFRSAAASPTALAAEIKKAVDEQLGAFGADVRNKALNALTGALEARLKAAITDAKGDLTSQLTTLVNSGFDALLSSQQLKDLYDIRDKIVIAGQKWCGAAAGDIKQISDFINDVADAAIADTSTIQRKAQSIRDAVRKFTLPPNLPSQVDALRPALDRVRAAAQQTLDRLDTVLADLAAARAQLQKVKWTALDCTKLGPPLELSGRIFDLRRRAILEVRNLAQHLVDADDLVKRMEGLGPAVLGSTPPSADLRQAVTDIANALGDLLRGVTSLGTITATPGPGSLWDRVQKQVNDIVTGVAPTLKDYAKELGNAIKEVHDVGLSLQKGITDAGTDPAKILDVVRQVAGFSVDQERRLAALVLQIVVVDSGLAASIATRVDTILAAIGKVLAPIHDAANKAVTTLLGVITPNPSDPADPHNFLAVLVRDDVRQNIKYGQSKLADDLTQFNTLQSGPADQRIKAAQALRDNLGKRPLGLILAAQPLLDLVEAMFKGHIGAIFSFGALQGYLQQAIQKLLPTRIDLAYDWNTDIGSFPPGDPILAMKDSNDQDLVLKSRVTIDLLDPVGGRQVSVDGALRAFDVKLLGTAPDLATIRFKGATFSAGTGRSFSFSAPIDSVEIGSALEFVQALASWLSPGKGNGPYVAVSLDPPGVVAGFHFDAGLITLGEMQFLNVAFDVSGLLPFDDRAAQFRFALADPDCPFLIVCVPYGGGGYVGLTATAKGIQQIAASFEFGAVVAVNFAVLQGQGRVSTGIYIEQDVDAGGVIAGFVHAVGEGHIACFGVSVNIEVRIEQRSGPSGSQCTGSANYRFKFSLGLCDVSYGFTASYAVQGSHSTSSSARLASQSRLLSEARKTAPTHHRPVKFCNMVPDKSRNWKEYRRRIAIGAIGA